jgi:hypothetical protein
MVELIHLIEIQIPCRLIAWRALVSCNPCVPHTYVEIGRWTRCTGGRVFLRILASSVRRGGEATQINVKLNVCISYYWDQAIMLRICLFPSLQWRRHLGHRPGYTLKCRSARLCPVVWG